MKRVASGEPVSSQSFKAVPVRIVPDNRILTLFPEEQRDPILLGPLA
jgi:hypothetical protein